MSRILALKQKQVTAICKGAAAAGFIPEIRIGQVVVRLVPEALAVKQRLDELVADPLDAELAAFEAKHGGGHA